jgi:hypothetical protein
VGVRRLSPGGGGDQAAVDSSRKSAEIPLTHFRFGNREREGESWASARLSGDDELRDPLALQSRERAPATGTRLSESARGRKLS